MDPRISYIRNPLTPFPVYRITARNCPFSNSISAVGATLLHHEVRVVSRITTLFLFLVYERANFLKSKPMYVEQGLLELSKPSHVKIQSTTQRRIMKLIVCYEITLVFDTIMEEWENIVYSRSSGKRYQKRINDVSNNPVTELFESARRSYNIGIDEMGNQITFTNKVMYTSAWF